jgi:dCMP deaminase
MRRPIEKYFLDIAYDISTRGTCPRLQVGCVLVNKHNHIIATGYNGVAAGLPHCTDEPCPGAFVESGKGTGTCEAIHAEQNALLQCKDIHEIEVAYITHSPCKTCIKLLLNTSCKKIVFSCLSTGIHTDALALWIKAERSLVHNP